MARNFPGAENRTEEQQERRQKNTVAARVSRTKNKAYETLLEERSIDIMTENINMKRRIACLRIYANSLMQANGFPENNFGLLWESNIKDILAASKPTSE